jgi:molybdopterin converting factor small subunit
MTERTVRINIPMFLQHLTGGLKTATAEGITVGDCLDHFVKQFPGAGEILFRKNGRLFSHLDVYLNGKSTFPEELDREVNDGDEISFLYLITGG